MFTLPSVVQVFICLQPTDLRKSFDSLAALVSKILFWDRSGYCLYYKRLEAGTFRIPVQTDSGVVSCALGLPELTLMLEGIDLTHARHRKRFSLQQSK